MTNAEMNAIRRANARKKAEQLAPGSGYPVGLLYQAFLYSVV